MRSHLPLASVDRLATLFVVIFYLEKHCCLNIFPIRLFRVDNHVGIVFPLVGISHFDSHCSQFFLRFCFCCVAHPRKVCNMFRQRRTEIAYEREHLFLRRFGEVFFDVKLSERLSQVVIRCAESTFPARLVLLCTGNHFADVERSSAEIVAQVAGCGVHKMERQIVAYGLLVLCQQEVINLLQRFGLHYAQFRHLREIERTIVAAPIDCRARFAELRTRIHIILRSQVALLGARHSNFRQFGFDVHHASHHSVGIGLRITRNEAHLGDVLLISFANLESLSIVEQIVVSIAQAHTGLTPVEDVHT